MFKRDKRFIKIIVIFDRTVFIRFINRVFFTMKVVIYRAKLKVYPEMKFSILIKDSI